MNINKRFFVFLMFGFVLLTSCSVAFKIPDNGVFYCASEEISLDFNDNSGVYIKDGESTKFIFRIDYGATIFFFDISDDEETVDVTKMFFSGSFKYKDEQVIISTEDGENLVFDLREK